MFIGSIVKQIVQRLNGILETCMQTFGNKDGCQQCLKRHAGHGGMKTQGRGHLSLIEPKQGWERQRLGWDENESEIWGSLEPCVT